MSPDLAFLHTSPVHVPTFTALLERVRPGAKAIHVVEEGLLQEARQFGHDAPQVVEKVHQAVFAAADSGAKVVICTCSTIGGAAESTPTRGRFWARRIDRAMADAAARLGPEILIVAALESTLGPTSALVHDSSLRLQTRVSIVEHLVPGAWHHFEQGHLDKYYASIETSVRKLLPGPSVVVLAQASMAPAEKLLQGISVPVLSSPELGVLDALRTVARAA